MLGSTSVFSTQLLVLLVLHSVWIRLMVPPAVVRILTVSRSGQLALVSAVVMRYQ